ncbi:metal-sensitive transcriptional regulator [Paenibacillus sp. MMS18-CY102]|uniref:metal-sensitive transcriptional regulator n=1 Tax=Paenibacillus sp. MMS18-CY102 TaxID=2682849 RepID=UPI003FA6F62D
MDRSHKADQTQQEKMACHDDCATNGGGERKSHHSDKTKANLIARLNRVEGQIRGIKGLIDKDTYCDDVLNQIAAAQSALNSVGKLLLENHLKSCVTERLQEGDEQVIAELMITMNKLIR